MGYYSNLTEHAVIKRYASILTWTQEVIGGSAEWNERFDGREAADQVSESINRKLGKG